MQCYRTATSIILIRSRRKARRLSMDWQLSTESSSLQRDLVSWSINNLVISELIYSIRLLGVGKRVRKRTTWGNSWWVLQETGVQLQLSRNLVLHLLLSCSREVHTHFISGRHYNRKPYGCWSTAATISDLVYTNIAKYGICTGSTEVWSCKADVIT